MTIKGPSFRFYCIFLYLASYSGLHPPPSFVFFTLHRLSFSSFYLSLFTALHLYSVAFAQIKLRLQFCPSPSTYLCFMTRTKSILCCYWSPLLPPSLLITLLLKSTQTILPFARWFFPLLSCGDLECITTICVWRSLREKSVTDRCKMENLTRRWQVKLIKRDWNAGLELKD